jgi:hypothetical protein
LASKATISRKVNASFCENLRFFFWPIYVCENVYIYIFTYMYVCMYVCVYMCIYAYM